MLEMAAATSNTDKLRIERQINRHPFGENSADPRKWTPLFVELPSGRVGRADLCTRHLCLAEETLFEKEFRYHWQGSSVEAETKSAGNNSLWIQISGTVSMKNLQSTA